MQQIILGLAALMALLVAVPAAAQRYSGHGRMHHRHIHYRQMHYRPMHYRYVRHHYMHHGHGYRR